MKQIKQRTSRSLHLKVQATPRNLKVHVAVESVESGNLGITPKEG